jgi:hypothetical protein
MSYNNINMKQFFVAIFLFLFLLFPVDNAQASIVGFANTGLWIQPPHYVLEGQTVRFFANIVNGEYEVFKGDLIFHVNDEHIGETISFELNKEESRVFSTSWLAVAGEFEVTAQIENVCFVCTASGEPIETALPGSLLRDHEILIVDRDSDGDGLGDEEEKRLGTNPLKVDTDGDGYSDKEEVGAGTNPLNPTSFPGLDTDGDGISDRVDTDIDNDGLYNWEEEVLGTDPYKRDADGDGVGDKEDCYPLDPTRWLCEEDKESVQDDRVDNPQVVNNINNSQNNDKVASLEVDLKEREVVQEDQENPENPEANSLDFLGGNDIDREGADRISGGEVNLDNELLGSASDGTRDQNIAGNQEQVEASFWNKVLGFLSFNQKDSKGRELFEREKDPASTLERENLRLDQAEEKSGAVKEEKISGSSFITLLLVLLSVSLLIFLLSLWFFLLAKRRKEDEEKE